MGNDWAKGPHDEDSDDKLIDEMGRVHKMGGHPGGKPPNRSCALMLVAGGGAVAALLAALAECVSRLV